MSAASVIRALGAGIGLAACATGPSDRVSLRGRFGAPFADRTAYLALDLRERDGNVSGRAWSSVSPALAAGVRVSGRYEPPVVTLQIHPDFHFGLSDWHFEGTFQQDTLRGTFSLTGASSQDVVLPRVSAMPLGDYSLKLSGAVTDSLVGWAVFNYGGGGFRLVQSLSSQQASLSSLVIFWGQRDRPAPGSYPVSAEGPGATAPSIRFLLQQPEGPMVRYRVQSGTLVIEESARYVLAGWFAMVAADSVGQRVLLQGRFNSACSSTAC